MGACNEDGKRKKKSKKDKKDRKAQKEQQPETAALIEEKPLATTTAQVPMYQPAAVPPAAVSAFDALDRNHDGVLTREEFAQARVQHVQQVQVGYPAQSSRQLYIGS